MLGVLPSEIQLSYKLASQTKDELARALVKSQDLTYLMQECKPFLTGDKKCRGNKPFRIQLMSRSTVSETKEDTKLEHHRGKMVSSLWCAGGLC